MCLRTQARLAEIWRKLSAHHRNLIGRTVNEILHMGNVFKLEELSYRVLQGMFGKPIATRAWGSISRNPPTRLRVLAEKS